MKSFVIPDLVQNDETPDDTLSTYEVLIKELFKDRLDTKLELSNVIPEGTRRVEITVKVLGEANEATS